MGILTFLAQSGYDDPALFGTETVDTTTSVLFFVGMAFFVLIFTFIVYALHAVFLGKIFKKAGIPQWIAWVPIYNSWKLLEIGGQQGFWAILAIIPVVNIVSAVFMYIAMYNIGLKLGQEGIFVLLAIFLPTVWLIWLAIDKSTWDDRKGEPSLAPATGPTTPTATV